MSTREEVNALKDQLFSALDVQSAAAQQSSDAKEALAKAQASADTADENFVLAKADVESKKQSLKEAIDNVT